MQKIRDIEEAKRWVELSGDDVTMPFEAMVDSEFKFLSFSDYSAIFLRGTIRAACHWSRQHDMLPFAMFFTIPSPLEYFDEAGFYGGLTANGDDDPAEIAQFLNDNNRWNGVFSVYDASHRFFVLPSNRSWKLVGDRDADLAIFSFATAEQRKAFVEDAGVVMFESAADAAVHAKSFMEYELDRSVFRQS